MTVPKGGTAKIWNACTVVYTQTSFGHAAGVHPAADAADGATVPTASEDGAATTWKSYNGECIQTLSGQERLHSLQYFQQLELRRRQLPKKEDLYKTVRKISSV